MIIEKWDFRFLRMADMVSTWSKDPSTQVGSVIVRPDRTVASVGYNGFPKQMLDTNALYNNREEKYSRIVHAEINALTFCNEKVQGYTVYVTPFMPCDRCFVQLVQSGITRVVAPRAAPEKEERWGVAFAKVRQYARECGVSLDEVDFE